MHEPVDHVVVSLLEYSVIIDELNYLVWLYVLRDTFLRLNELIESLQLTSHVVYGIVNRFLNLHKFMIISVGSH